MKRMLPGTSRRELRVEGHRRAENADEVERITGYGAVFFNASDAGTEYWLWSDVVERIMPGAFDRALREDDVRSFFNHDANFILGRTTAKTLELSIDSVGLGYAVTPSDSAIAQHSLSAVRRGDVNGSSFMFEVGAATWVEQPSADGSRTLWIRQITEVKPLYEIGPVCFPAYEATTAEAEGRTGEGGHPTIVAPAAAAWRTWYERHVERARESLDAFRTARSLERIGDDKARRQRRARAFEFRQKSLLR